MSSRLRAGLGDVRSARASGGRGTACGSRRPCNPARSPSSPDTFPYATVQAAGADGADRRHARHRIPAEGQRPGGQAGHRRHRRGVAQVPHAEPRRRAARGAARGGARERRLREQPVEAQAEDGLPACRSPQPTQQQTPTADGSTPPPDSEPTPTPTPTPTPRHDATPTPKSDAMPELTKPVDPAAADGGHAAEPPKDARTWVTPLDPFTRAAPSRRRNRRVSINPPGPADRGRQQHRRAARPAAACSS